MKYLLFMYHLGTTVLKDLRINQEVININEKFDSFNLIEEINENNINEIYNIIEINQKNDLIKTLESSNITYETKISLLNLIIAPNYSKNHIFNDLLDDWNFEF